MSKRNLYVLTAENASRFGRFASDLVALRVAAKLILDPKMRNHRPYLALAVHRLAYRFGRGATGSNSAFIGRVFYSDEAGVRIERDPGHYVHTKLPRLTEAQKRRPRCLS